MRVKRVGSTTRSLSSKCFSDVSYHVYSPLRVTTSSKFPLSGSIMNYDVDPRNPRDRKIMAARTNLITGDGDIDVEKSSVSGISLIFCCRFIFALRFLFAHKSQLYVALCAFFSFLFLIEELTVQLRRL